MRLLHVIKGLGPGGAERLLVSLTQARSAGVQVDVAYLLPHKSHLVAELEAAGARCHLLAGSRGIADPRWPVELVRLVRRTSPDVVHVHSPAVAAVARPLLRAMPRRPRIVTTEHNLWASFGRLTRLSNAVTIWLDDASLAVSEEVRSSAWAFLQPRIEVSIQGVPARSLARRRKHRTRARDELGLRSDELLVVTVANFREKKDYPTLLAVAASVTSVRSDVTFLAIGQGPLEDDLQRLHGELGLGERFRFAGYVADPSAMVVAADLFVLTSRHEGLPIALLEAMALGVPPIATRVGGVPSVITDGTDGILLPVGDVGAFASAIAELADDPERRTRLATAAATRAMAFDVAETQSALELRYRSLTEGRGRSGSNGPCADHGA